jgi:hypothetical protein
MSWTEQSKKATRIILGAFRGMPGMDTGNRETDVMDLMTNLLHVIREDGGEPEVMLGKALGNYHSEVQEILEDAERQLDRRDGAATLKREGKFRHADIRADKVLLVKDASFSDHVEQMEVYGRDLSGKPVWILIHGPITFETRQLEAPEPERVEYETTIVITHWAKDDAAAMDASREFGDEFFHRPDVLRIEGHGRPAGADDDDASTGATPERDA